MTINSAFWRDRPTLVTGGTGLVGEWLVRRLLAYGADVHGACAGLGTAAGPCFNPNCWAA
jgi:NAD(P)-dependent dehydrogenase (short-subunit alcohol dehydrogenase family)